MEGVVFIDIIFLIKQMIEVFEKQQPRQIKRNRGNTFEDLSVNQVCLIFNSSMLKISRFEVQQLNVSLFLHKKYVSICMFNTTKIELVCFIYLCFSYYMDRRDKK